MTLNELLASQTAAGARYRAATEELHDALVDLGGIDAALMNGTCDYARDVRSFHDLPQNLGRLAHPKYAQANLLADWNDEIAARRNAILAKFNKG
jgi:hypothetical protein